MWKIHPFSNFIIFCIDKFIDSKKNRKVGNGYPKNLPFKTPNSNIISGDFRLIDLFSSPFKFSRNYVVDRVNDYPEGHPVPSEMILIEKQHVPFSIEYWGSVTQDKETELVYKWGLVLQNTDYTFL